MHVSKITPRSARHDADPLTAAAYFGLRRRAAGYSVDALARAILIVADHTGYDRHRLGLDEQRARVARMRDIVVLLERPGAVTRNGEGLSVLASLFPFDPAVYRHLADGCAGDQPRVCRGCGCSQDDPCIVDHDGGEHVCQLVTASACSHCVTGAIAQAQAA